MHKTEITVVIPAVGPMENCAIFRSYEQSGSAARLYVQFVYLHNPKKVEHKPSVRTEHATHEILYVGSDRYISSCEENIFRVQDFADILKPHIFIVGDHDLIHWDALEEALAYRAQHNLDALSWNLVSHQDNPDGSFSTIDQLALINDPCPANHYMDQLMKGAVFESAIAYPALLSFYGPMYWTAYIGNHLYSKPVFMRFLQYRFAENLCAQVYMQALLFSERSLRYGLFPKPVITRVGDEFEKLHQGTYTWGWIEDHRTHRGNSVAFSIVHLAHINQIENDALFHLLATSMGLSLARGTGGGQTYGRYFMLNEALSWTRDALRERLQGRSTYFPELARKGTLQDIRYGNQFFTRVLTATSTYPGIYAAFEPACLQAMLEGVVHLTHYLHALEGSDEMLLAAFEKFTLAQTSLSMPMLTGLNQAAFAHYLQGRTAQAAA